MANKPRIGIISTYEPRLCGIATYTQSLLRVLDPYAGSPATVVAMAAQSESVQYGERVGFVVAQEEEGDYARAADFLSGHTDVVLLQHEFGLFGGNDGEYVLDLVDRLDVPLVVTLHTVLSSPTANQRRIVRRLAEAASMTVVMAEHSRALLATSYGIDGGRVRAVPHGVPDVLGAASRRRDAEAVPGRRPTILSSGFLGPGKGFERVIRALPDVVQSVPGVRYLIVGQTHPEVLRRSGESYRESLAQLSRDLGVEDHVQFIGCFVPEDDLIRHMLEADVFITPYESREQSSSGALSYAMAAGSAIVSTPYPFAAEMLREGAGLLVQHESDGELVRALTTLLTDGQLRGALGARAFGRSRGMTWTRVGEAFGSLLADQVRRPRVVARRERPAVSRSHLFRLADNTGVMQHAVGPVPNRAFGYCTDDTARALKYCAEEPDLQTDPLLRSLFDTSFAFVVHAYNEETGRFRNFMSYDRRWLDEGGSDDTQGRAIEALACVAANPPDGAYYVAASSLLLAALSRDAVGTVSPRGIATALVGLRSYLERHPGDSTVTSHARKLARRLAPWTEERDVDWPWHEDTLTYENARLPEALIAAGRALDEPSYVAAGLRLGEWLFCQQTDPQGRRLSLVGSDGWWHRDGRRARFDQQPVEIVSLVGLALQAYAVTTDAVWAERAKLAYGWFFGANDLSVSLHEPATGGCYDGLESQGVNKNQGAESTLALLLSTQAMRRSNLIVENAEQAAGGTSAVLPEPARAS